MYLNFGPFLTNFIISNIAAFCIAYWIKKTYHFGLAFSRILVALIFICTLRMFLPMDFFFTKSIHSTVVLPALFDFVRKPFWKSFSILQVLFIIWGTGAAWKAAVALRERYYLRKTLTLFTEVTDERILAVFQRVNHKKYPIRLMQGEIAGAKIVGLIRPVILLPNQNLDEEELTHIFSHEIGHYAHHDLWLKLFVHITRIIYWWNPLMKYLSMPVHEMTELRNDLSVIDDMDQKERLEYAACIVAMAEQAQPMPEPAYAFSMSETDTLKKRINSIVTRTHMQPKQIVAMLLLSLLVISPFFVNVNAEYPIPQGVFTTQEDHMFILHINGHYYLFINGIKATELDGQPDTEDIPIVEEGEGFYNEK